MSGTPIINQIQHYQKSIEKCSDNEKRILHCIEKLYMLPVTVQHLQETGVGRTINALRKYEGTVGDAAKALVAKWKTMVVDEESSDGDDAEVCVPDISEGYSDNSDSSVDKDFQDQNTRCKPRDSRNRKNKKFRECESKHGSSHHEQSSSDNSKQKNSIIKNYHENYTDRNKNDIDQCLRLKTNMKNYDSNHESKRKRKSVNPRELRNDKHVSKKIDDNTPNHSHDEFNIAKKKYSNELLSHSKSNMLVNNNTNDSHKTQKRRTFSTEKSMDKRQNSIIDESEDEKKTPDTLAQSDDECNVTLYNNRASTSKMMSVDNKKFKEKSEENSKVKVEKPESSKHKSKNDYKLSHQKIYDKKKEETQNISIIFSSHSNDTNSQRKDKNEDKTKKNHREKQEKRKLELEHKSKVHKKKREKIKINDHEGIDCNSGTSFAEALGMCAGPVFLRKKNPASPGKLEGSTSSNNKLKVKIESPKNDEPLSLLSPNVKLEPLRVDLDSTLPEISPNYKPLPLVPAIHRKLEERKALDNAIYAKNIRTKVYSGNKASYTSVPSLYELCIRVLIENIEALEFTGGVPYYIIKPVLERATADQLFMIEHYNPYLIEDTDELWKFHCNREFRNKEREEMESWREMYMRCLDEREAKLKTLTANIKQSIDKSLPVRSTIMAYVDDVVKPPRNILRKQVKYGTARTAASSSDIKKKIITSSNSATNVSVPPPSISRASGIVKKNKAPLMAKALQLIKGRYKR